MKEQQGLISIQAYGPECNRHVQVFSGSKSKTGACDQGLSQDFHKRVSKLGF